MIQLVANTRECRIFKRAIVSTFIMVKKHFKMCSGRSCNVTNHWLWLTKLANWHTVISN